MKGKTVIWSMDNGWVIWQVYGKCIFNILECMKETNEVMDCICVLLYNDLKWYTMTYNDLQLLQMICNDPQWLRNDLQWPKWCVLVILGHFEWLQIIWSHFKSLQIIVDHCGKSVIKSDVPCVWMIWVIWQGNAAIFGSIHDKITLLALVKSWQKFVNFMILR